MVQFSHDVDILRYEPALFGELHLPSQVRTTGTGATLSGVTLTALDADFTAAGIALAYVVYLRSADGTLDGAYEIVSVDSATQLTISVLRPDPSDVPIAPPAAGDIAYRICTFEPQANDAGFELTEYFGIQPGNPASAIVVDDIMDAEVLRRPSTFAVIARIYAMWSGGSDTEHFHRKSLHYGQLYEKARQRCRLSIDPGSDGVADITRIGGSIRLVRD